jgi:hypothetical protein
MDMPRALNENTSLIQRGFNIDGLLEKSFSEGIFLQRKEKEICYFLHFMEIS